MGHLDYFAHSGDGAASGAERFTSGWSQPSLGERKHGSTSSSPTPADAARQGTTNGTQDSSPDRGSADRRDGHGDGLPLRPGRRQPRIGQSAAGSGSQGGGTDRRWRDPGPSAGRGQG